MKPGADRELMGVELCPSTLCILLANTALDGFISYNMAIKISLLLNEVDGCMTLVLLLMASLSLCKYDPCSPLLTDFLSSVTEILALAEDVTCFTKIFWE